MKTNMRRFQVGSAMVIALSSGWGCESQSSSDAVQNSVHNEARAEVTPRSEDPTEELTQNPPRAIGLLSAPSTPGVGVSFIGIGDSTQMLGTVRNDTEEHLIITVEVGTKLTPDNGNTQSMVVTEEVEVSVDKYETHDFSIQVACLDISKAAPSQSDDEWTIEHSPQLAAFIECVNECLDEKAQQEGEPALLDEIRTTFVQLGLWQARGASLEDWIAFFVEYQDMTREQAEEMIELLRPLLDELTSRCPDL